MVDKLIARNPVYISFFLVALIFLLISGHSYYKSNLEKKQLIAIATGEPSTESYKIMNAVARIINKENFDFTIKVVSTQGSIENIGLLEKGLVQMGTLKSDLDLSNNIRLVANLYEEVFHLIYQPAIRLKSIEDINGLKVAIPSKNSGEYNSFSLLVKHFGLDQSKIQPVLSTWKSATWLFENGNVDAIFRVREANHEGIRKFITTNNSHADPITQSEAISLNFPMYHKSIIPRGSYSGIPPNPGASIETLGVDKLLVATNEVPATIVNDILTVLFTRKRELSDYTKVAGLTKVPIENSLIPWHAGLTEFVNKEKPGFIQRNAEFLALILSVFILLGSSFIQVFNRKKQLKLNSYNEQLLAIKINVEQTRDLQDLAKLREEHFALVNQIVGDAVQGRISSDGFEFFTFGWDSVTRLINDKEKDILNE